MDVSGKCRNFIDSGESKKEINKKGDGWTLFCKNYLVRDFVFYRRFDF